MDAAHWQRVSAIFDRVADAPAGQRVALLDELCGGNAEVRRDVEQLLAADQSGGRFDSGVDAARGEVAMSWSSDDDRETAQTRVGPWRVLRELGRGGMGVVLLAERADGQFEQRAALKIIKRGMDSDAVQSRFLRERQILARLEHPHIARLLDGGIADDGRPYFAMEYIDGEPLLRYAAQCELSVEKRIILFCDICAAVQFAHGQLVIHRDIKPSNILITGEGEAKLLDFGIAKLLDDSHGGMTQTADALNRPLTPAYAAPEQLRGDPVSTATDIYSLGVVLFELLTGKRPYDLRDDADRDIARRTFDSTTTTPLPSRVVDDTAPASARLLRGDLDTIVVTAMQRDPLRRYATADSLARDLQRYLAGQPISARRDSVGYRFHKFVDRHRIGVGAATVGVIALVAALVFAVWQAHEKSQQALMSQQVTQFLVGIFRGADPSISRGSNATAKDLLDQGTERLRSDANVEPNVRARLLSTIATTYADLGLYDRASPLAKESLALRRSVGAPETDVAESLDALGRIDRLKADFVHAEPAIREAVAIRRAKLPNDDPLLIESLDNLGNLLSEKGDFQAAEGSFREAFERAERHFGKQAPETARYLDDYAQDVDNLGRRQDAEVLYRRALQIRETKLGPDDPDLAFSLINLGTFLDNQGNYAEAIPMIERADKIRHRVFGAEHPLTASAEISLAGVYLSVERIDDAQKLVEHAIAVFRRDLPDDHPKISEALNLLGVLHVSRRDYAAAVPAMREAAQRYRRTLGIDHPDTLTAENNLGYALVHADLLSEAETLLREVIARQRHDNGQPMLATVRENLASALAAEHKYVDAAAAARDALDIARKNSGEETAPVAIALRVLASMEELEGDAAHAEAHFRAAYDLGEKLHAQHISAAYEWKVPLADFLVGKNRCDEALTLLRSANADRTAENAQDPIGVAMTTLLTDRCEGTSNSPGDRAAIEKLRAIPAVEKELYPTAAALFAGAKIPQAPSASTH
jgi:eukaryotic-like serine/threonine-protein kinase